MIVTLGLAGLVAALLVLVVATTALLVAAPWLGEPAPTATHRRIGRAVLAFDFWLEIYSVRGRRRRELRDELRSNLYAAAADSGPREAVAGLGPLRALARETAKPSFPDPGPDPAAGPGADPGADLGTAGRSPSRGSLWAGVTLTVIVALSLVTSITWVDASLAGGAQTVAGRPLTSPWMYLDFRSGNGGETVSLGTSFAWWVLLPPLVAYAVGARVWRRSRRETVAA